MTETKSTSKNIKLGVLISYVTLVVSLVGNILVTQKVLNYVGDYNYGLFSFVNSITTWLAIVSNALGASFIRFATIEKKETGNENQTKTIYHRMFLIISIISMLGSGLVLLILHINGVQLFGYEKSSSDILYIMFGYSIIQIGITIAFNVYTLFISYKKKFIFARSLTLLMNIVLYSGNWIIAYFTKNIVYISLYAMVHSIVLVASQILYVRLVLKENGFYKTKIVDKGLIKRIIVFSSILLYGAIVSQISNYVDKTILGSMGLADDVTIYQLGQLFSTYVIVLSSSVVAVYIPTVNELVVENKNMDLNKLFLRVSRFQMIIVCMVVFGFLTAGKDFVILWVGEQRVKVFYIAAAWLLLLLCSETMNLSLEIQRARNKHLFRCVTFFILSVGNIGLSILLIHLMGREKAVEACLLGSIIINFLSNWVLLNLYNGMKMKLPMLRYFAMLFIHSFFGGIAFGLTFLLFMIPSLNEMQYSFASLLIKGGTFVFAYLILVLIFDRSFIKSIFFERKKAKLKGKKDIGTNQPSEEQIRKNMSFIINSRSIYYFKYTPEDLFVELGYVHELGYERKRKLLSRIIKLFPNSYLSKFLCKKIVPKIYPKKIIDLLNSKKNLCFFDAAVTPELLQYSLLNEKRKVLVYVWNKLEPNIFYKYLVQLLPQSSIITFSPIEAELYGIDYMPEPLYEIKGLVKNPKEATFEYDFYYLGRLKERGQLLVDYCKKLFDYGFKVNLEILCDEAKKDEYKHYPFINVITKIKTYEEYLEQVSLSRCLMEIASDENLNITWRPFESFLYKRRLLTNNKHVFDEPYLNTNNVLLVDLSNVEVDSIKKFIEEDYDSSADDISKWTHSYDDFIYKIYNKLNSD